jgi:4-carboxymuconolactone decarboxylase
MLQSTPETRGERGRRLLNEIDGEAGHAVIAGLQDIAPDFAELLFEFPFGDIYAREGLSLRDREIATVAALSAMATAPKQLGVHVQGALNVGVTRQEIVEIMIQMSVYAGFPAALNALAVAREVFAVRDLKIEGQ